MNIEKVPVQTGTFSSANINLQALHDCLMIK